MTPADTARQNATPAPASGGVRLSFVVPGAPQGKGRPRFVGGRAVTPKATRDYEAHVAACARGIHWVAPMSGPLSVQLDVVCARPASRPASVDREAWRTGERVPRIGKPDVDNAAKAILDGMVAGGVLVDDTHVTRLVVCRWYAARGEEPHVRVEVSA